MRRAPIVTAALLCVLGAALLPLRAQADPGCRPLRAVFYAATDWVGLAQGLAAQASPCAHYSISVPPLVADKTQMRSGQASQIRALGANFHALAEINVTAWQSWVSTNNSTWYQAGVEARNRMASAGFDVGAGDSWAVNELSSAVRQGSGMSRQNIRDLVRGLYDGGGSLTTSKGVIFVTGIGQPTTSLDTYKARLESWLQDPAFWTDMGAYVSDFMQETYGDIREYGVAGADVTTRLAHLNQYLEQVVSLASVAPSEASTAQSYLASSYGPLANAAWAWSSAFGYTAVPFDQMEDYVSAQVDAMRSYEASVGWSADRIGFAWSPSNSLGLSAGDFAAEEADVLSRLAQAIHDSADPTSPGAGACTSPWCTADVAGASFTGAWGAFSSWTPTTAAFASSPQSVTVGSASGPMSVQLQIGDVVSSLPVDSTVQLSSSSAGGSFSSGPSGPWTATLDLTVPAGSTSATFYMLDTAVGTPAETATFDGQSAEQVESVTAPSAPLTVGGADNTVTFGVGGEPAMLDPAVTVADTASSMLTSATVTISSGLDAGDSLSATTTGTGISSSFSGGVLTLSGTDTVADYQAVLRTVAFTGTATVSGSREILWSATDGTNTGFAVGTVDYAVLPDPPSDLVAGPGDGQATISFTPPGTDSGAPITSYTVTSTPGGKTASSAGSPITVTGLTDGTSYTFTVASTNAAGTGAASIASNAVTPSASGGGGGGSGGGGGGGAAPDLHVSVSAGPLPHAVGDELTYAVTIVNQGGSSSASTLNVDLPGGVTLVGTRVDRGPGCTASGQSVSCFLDFFPPALSSTVFLSVKVSSLGALVLTTSTSSSPGDANPADSMVTYTIALGTPTPATSTSGGSTGPASLPVVKPAVLQLAAVQLVKLGKHGATLHLRVKLSGHAELLLVLLDSHGRQLVIWRKSVRAGTRVLSLSLPKKARHKGTDRLRLRVVGGKATRTLAVHVR